MQTGIQIIDGHIKVSINGFKDRRSCYFTSGIEEPEIRTSFLPKLEEIYYQLK